MLKNCTIPTSYHKQNTNAKCGEIVYNAKSSFTIICTLCNIKLFDFSDFLLHFRNVHLYELHAGGGGRTDSGASTASQLASVAVKQPFAMEVVRGVCDDEPILFEEADGAPSTKHEADECDFLCTHTNVHPAKETEHLVEHNTSVDCGMEWKLDENDNTQCRSKELGDAEDAEDAEDPTPTEETTTVKATATATDSDYACEWCNKRYTTSHRLKYHVHLKHLHPKDVKCQQCDNEFSDSRALQSHIRKAHVQYPCAVCDKIYKSRVALREHLNTHKETKDVVCDYPDCGKAFASKKRLNVHKTLHTGERNYICEVCGYRTRLKDALVIHKRAHTGEKPFTCALCDKRFASRSLLNEHQPIHSNERPHKCDVCGAAFSRPKALYHHKHLHLGVKKFVCKVCGQAYAQAAGLSGHMRLHKMNIIK